MFDTDVSMHEDGQALAVLRRELMELLRTGDEGVLAVAARLRAARRNVGTAAHPPRRTEGGLGIAGAAKTSWNEDSSAVSESVVAANGVNSDDKASSAHASSSSSSKQRTVMSRQPSRCAMCHGLIDTKLASITLEWPSSVDDNSDWLAFTTSTAADKSSFPHLKPVPLGGPAVQCAACADVGCAL